MNLFVYCAGGFGLEVMDLARRINLSQKKWEHIGFIDDVHAQNEYYDTDLYSFNYVENHFNRNTFEIVIANGEPFAREALYNKLKSSGIRLATLVDSTAVISKTAKLDEGVIVLAFDFISSEVIIEANTALYTNSFIGHNSKIGANCVVSSGVNIAGHCNIGKNTFVGMGTKVKQKISVGKETIIGMGSVVLDDIQEGTVAYGYPAKSIRKNTTRKVFD